MPSTLCLDCHGKKLLVKAIANHFMVVCGSVTSWQSMNIWVKAGKVNQLKMYIHFHFVCKIVKHGL